MSLQAIYAHKTIGITDFKRGERFIDDLSEPIAVSGTRIITHCKSRQFGKI